MKQSQLFTKTLKNISKTETAFNAQLLMRGGFIFKEMAGVYDLLPLGLKVMNKINDIIRDEINNIGGQEVFLSALQDKKIWQKTDRWSDEIVDNWFKTKLKNGQEVGLGFTHEEPLARIMKNYISSYKDLPLYVYQIQTKFRNEKRAKSGLMRTREFLMKDLYSFTASQKDLDIFYEKAKDAYFRIFKRCGISDITYLTFASGGTFSKYSHEFQTLSEAGEDEIYLSKKNNIAINKEVYSKEILKELGLDEKDIVKKKAIEVGNIFKQDTKFSQPLGLKYISNNNTEEPVIMGAYGIGPGRLMGTIAEVKNDQKGLIWPQEIAPFAVHLIEIFSKNKAVKDQAELLYKSLQNEGIEVLYDDRPEIRAGEKFKDADLIGLPIQIIIGEQGLKKGVYEIKDRETGNTEEVSQNNVLQYMKKNNYLV